MTTPITGTGSSLAPPSTSGTTAAGTPADPSTSVDFGPAAVFTPSEQLANLQSAQMQALLGTSGDGVQVADPGSFTGTAFSQANLLTMYNSSGVAVPLSQAMSAGVASVGAAPGSSGTQPADAGSTGTDPAGAGTGGP